MYVSSSVLLWKSQISQIYGHYFISQLSLVTSARPACLFPAQQPPVGHYLLIYEVSRSHTTTHHSQQDSSGLAISSSQRPLPGKTQQSQQTNIHATSGIRTHNLNRRTAGDLRLRPRGHWDRPAAPLTKKKTTTTKTSCVMTNGGKKSECAGRKKLFSAYFKCER